MKGISFVNANERCLLPNLQKMSNQYLSNLQKKEVNESMNAWQFVVPFLGWFFVTFWKGSVRSLWITWWLFLLNWKINNQPVQCLNHLDCIFLCKLIPYHGTYKQCISWAHWHSYLCPPYHGTSSTLTPASRKWPPQKETNMECEHHLKMNWKTSSCLYFCLVKIFISGFNIGRFFKGCIPYFEDSLGSWFLPRFPHLDAGDDV